MDDDIRKRLRRLGVTKGTRHLKVPPVQPPQRPLNAWQPPDVPEDDREPHAAPMDAAPLEKLLPGSRLEENDAGACLVVDRVYPVNFTHGSTSLDQLLAWTTDQAIGYLPAVANKTVSFRNAIFLDTETTGLWGAATFAFMVGVGFFEADAFVIRQYFCRDHGDETAMLQMLNELIASREFLVTFNGQTFDIPLLETRYVMNRLVHEWPEYPNLDLLSPARRLWRLRCQSVALGSLEKQLLGIRRSGIDIPGAMIPRLYSDYLREQDGRELLRIFYHNEQDILSMVTLSAMLFQFLNQSAPAGNPLDLLSLARWQLRLGMEERAEQLLTHVIQGEMGLDAYRLALSELAQLLKRTGRSQHAVPYWQQLAVTSFDDINAHIELAKYFEWRAKMYSDALQWTERALAVVEQLIPIGWEERAKRERLLLECQHRQQRLLRKITAAS